MDQSQLQPESKPKIHRPARIGDRRRRVRPREPKGDSRGDLPGLVVPGFLDAQAAVAFLVLGFETKGVSIEQIDAQLSSARRSEAGAVKPIGHIGFSRWSEQGAE